jgi:hypothetical protein
MIAMKVSTMAMRVKAQTIPGTPSTCSCVLYLTQKPPSDSLAGSFALIERNLALRVILGKYHHDINAA